MTAKFGWVSGTAWVAISIATVCSTFAQQSGRPRIIGISHMGVYASDAAAAEHFYMGDLGATKGTDPENAQGTRYYFSRAQFVEVLPLPAEHSISRMDHVAFTTENAESLRSYLMQHAVRDVSEVRKGSDGSSWFDVKDPEGNKIQFVQQGKPGTDEIKPDLLSSRVIHVGFLVHDRAAEDRFYKDVLGFRPYWYGAMQPDKVDWISQQVPDGHDWLEYMMVGEGSTTPEASLNQQHLGVLNHFSLGVPNMEKAVTLLIGAERMSPRHDGPQMGKDGKWQANLYDPDGTRVELMEFQPVIKPCCSGFTAESPAD